MAGNYVDAINICTVARFFVLDPMVVSNWDFLEFLDRQKFMVRELKQNGR